MIGMIDQMDIERFRSLISQRMGLHFEDAKFDFLSEIMRRRMDKLGCSSAQYLWTLENARVDGELQPLAQDITVTETYFFRNIQQFHALSHVVIPSRMSVRTNLRTLRMLSAACSSGEEAYTLAMVAKSNFPDETWGVDIRAIDINPLALEKAQRGRYAAWSLRETPADMKYKWFRKDGRDYTVVDDIRASVSFESHNIADDKAVAWLPETYDVIFCRNVMMYFSPEHQQALIARIARSLAPGGYLFLGHAETLRGVSDDFHLCHSHDTFYYQRKDEWTAAPPQFSMPRMAPVIAPAPLPRQTAASVNDWMTAIPAANERITALLAETQITDQPLPTWSAQAVHDLLHRERFTDALDYIRGLPKGADRDPDILLLKAVLLLQGEEFKAASSICGKVLEISELNAGAHYVLALCSENARDLDGAMEHDRVAIYLDPTFAMPHLHMGILAHKSGDSGTAHQAFEQALILFKHEDSSRLLVFGGGFNRHALISLCETMLRGYEGRL